MRNVRKRFVNIYIFKKIFPLLPLFSPPPFVAVALEHCTLNTTKKGNDDRVRVEIGSTLSRISMRFSSLMNFTECDKIGFQTSRYFRSAVVMAAVAWKN